MKFGLTLPQSGTLDLHRDLTMVARQAEAAGWHSLWAYERVLFPLDPTDGLYGVPGARWPDRYRHTADPLTVLALAAAVTDVVRLGTCVLVAGLHSSLQLARQLATLDQATGGGRVIAGLGSGWSSDEYRACGADFARRGRLLEETLDALAALWGPNPVSYRDSRMAVRTVVVDPKPVSPIPVMLGGGTTPRALDRIARRAQGWIPSGMAAAALAEPWHTVRALAARHGRDPDAIALVPLLRIMLTDAPASADRLPCQGSIAQVVSDIAELDALGATEVICAVSGVTSGTELVETSGALIAALTDSGLCTQ